MGLSLNPIADIISAVGGVAENLITTDKERLQFALEDKKIDAGLQQGQIDVNKVEAASSSLWTSGWRPYVGWVAGTALACAYIPKTLVLTAMWMYQAIVIISAWNGGGVTPTIPLYPDLGLTDLFGLLGAMLGLGSLRTLEKVKGVAS